MNDDFELPPIGELLMGYVIAVPRGPNKMIIGRHVVYPSFQEAYDYMKDNDIPGLIAQVVWPPLEDFIPMSKWVKETLPDIPHNFQQDGGIYHCLHCGVRPESAPKSCIEAWRGWQDE